MFHGRFAFAGLALAFLIACAPAVGVAPTPAPEATSEPAPSGENTGAPQAIRPALSPDGVLAEGQIEFAVVDVGQGDGLVLRTASGITIVVDTGTGSGGKAIKSYLRARGINTIDLLVLTHPHADHIGGVPALLKSMQITSVWISGFPSDTRTQARVLSELESRGVPTTEVREGTRATVDGNIEISVIGPKVPLITNSRSDANANSIVLWIKFGEIDFLLTGDAESETESRVLEVLRGRPPPTFEVLKVAHHGSRYASSANFLERVSPQVALISCGRANRYKHPHPETLERLKRAGAQVFRTDLHGTIRLRTDGQSILIIKEHQQSGDTTQTHHVEQSISHETAAFPLTLGELLQSTQPLPDESQFVNQAH